MVNLMRNYWIELTILSLFAGLDVLLFWMSA